MTPSSPAQVMIGLDVGTTDVKAAAFGLGSGWRSVAIREYPLLQPAPGEEVQDPARRAISDRLRMEYVRRAYGVPRTSSSSEATSTAGSPSTRIVSADATCRRCPRQPAPS